MVVKCGILLIALLAGCLAKPALDAEEDMSMFFDHVDPESRILGGVPAAAGSAPYMVALASGTLVKNYVCGGSLISTRTVLTAAHCIRAQYGWNGLSGSLQGRIGSINWQRGGTTMSFRRNVTHPHYVHHEIKNDIGLLITTSAVRLSPTVQLVPLSYEHVGAGVAVRATGWGHTKWNGATSNVLRELTLSTISGAECVRRVRQDAIDFNYAAPAVDPALELCVYHSVGHGMCTGDSGSALVRSDTRAQVGVVSWGFPCAVGTPDMFARVSAYQEFIQTNIA